MKIDNIHFIFNIKQAWCNYPVYSMSCFASAKIK